MWLTVRVAASLMRRPVALFRETQREKAWTQSGVKRLETFVRKAENHLMAILLCFDMFIAFFKEK